MAKLKFDKEIKIKIPPQRGFRFIKAYLASDDEAMHNFEEEIDKILEEHGKTKKNYKIVYGKKYLFLYESKL